MSEKSLGLERESENDKWQRANLVLAITSTEQTQYWNRFAAFAALHAGLIVISRSEWYVSAFGVILALVWCAVQWLSVNYVDRDKSEFKKSS